MSLSKEWEWYVLLARDEDLRVAWENYLSSVPAVQEARKDAEQARQAFLEASELYELDPNGTTLKEFVTATNILKTATVMLKAAERNAAR